MRIVDGADYVTLLTCTPYSINTHRLLVRGKRVKTDAAAISDKSTVGSVSLQNDCLYLLGYKIPYWVAATVIVVFVGLVVFAVIMIVKKRKKKERHLEQQKNLKANTDAVNNIDGNTDGD